MENLKCVFNNSRDELYDAGEDDCLNPAQERVMFGGQLKTNVCDKHYHEHLVMQTLIKLPADHENNIYPIGCDRLVELSPETREGVFNQYESQDALLSETQKFDSQIGSDWKYETPIRVKAKK